MSAPRTDEPAALAASSSSTSPGIPSGPLLDARLRQRFAAPARVFVLEAEFRAAPGFTILFGPSGAGKTTVLDCVAGLAKPDSGRITIGDRSLFDGAQGTDLAVAKRRVGYVFQSLALFPHLTVEKNVQYGLTHLPQGERAMRTSAILQAFRIAHLAQRYPREISGGESQRTALARTLVTDPAVLLWTNHWPRWTLRRRRRSLTICARGTRLTAFPSFTSRTAARKSLPWASA